MATNRFFNKINHAQEQKLYGSLVTESFQINGIDVLYLPRKIVEFDDILKEPTKSSFSRAFPIEAYFIDNGNYQGDQNLISKFGFRINQTTELLIAKDRFEQLGTGLIRPTEGDLVYIGDPTSARGKFTNTLMQINQVWYGGDGANADWQFGTHSCYKLVCETFIYSYESIKLGRQVPDSQGTEALDMTGDSDSSSLSNKPIFDAALTTLFDKNNPFADV